MYVYDNAILLNECRGNGFTISIMCLCWLRSVERKIRIHNLDNVEPDGLNLEHCSCNPCLHVYINR